ncbi:MAG: OmpA family protein [bacterium]|nr:OmpA family protein [bacterium]
MRTTMRIVLLLTVAASAALIGCAPCSDYKQLVAERDGSILSLQSEIAAREATIAEGRQLAAGLREQMAQLEAEKAVLVEQNGEVVNVALTDELAFSGVSLGIGDKMKPVLAALKEACDQYPGWDIHVEGGTDDNGVPGDYREIWPTSWELAAARASAVARYMTNELGMEATRFAVVSYGPFRPVGDNTTAEGRARNNAVRFTLHKPEGLWLRNK